jgi:hypothetical protein
VKGYCRCSAWLGHLPVGRMRRTEPRTRRPRHHPFGLSGIAGRCTTPVSPRSSRSPCQLTIIQRHRIRPGTASVMHSPTRMQKVQPAAASGHDVIWIEVARVDFPILRTKDEFETSPLAESLVEARDAIVGAASGHDFPAMARDDAGPPQRLPRTGDAARVSPSSIANGVSRKGSSRDGRPGTS